MEALTMFDPQTGKYEPVYEAICRCGAKLTILEVKALGDRCSSCEMHYIEQEQIAQQAKGY